MAPWQKNIPDDGTHGMSKEPGWWEQSEPGESCGGWGLRGSVTAGGVDPPRRLGERGVRC